MTVLLRKLVALTGEHESVVHGDLSVLVPLLVVVYILVVVVVVVVDGHGGVGPVEEPGQGDVGGGLPLETDF